MIRADFNTNNDINLQAFFQIVIIVVVFIIFYLTLVVW